MTRLQLHHVRRDQWPHVAALIHESTNQWYLRNGRQAIFQCPASDVELFCEVYEQLDPGCCLAVEDLDTGRLAGSCFYHPRSTHVSLGIMNAHPDFFGQGVARQLLEWIVDFARQEQKPVRLVSSAMNLDSYSLYNRAGFVPRIVFQDMLLTVGADGLAAPAPAAPRVRPASLDDVKRIAMLERQQVGIEREADYRYFAENQRGIWRLAVAEDNGGELVGFLNSVTHSASNMLGPGWAADSAAAAALLYWQLDRQRGRTPVWLVPAEAAGLIRTLYDWGARNCELHLAQVCGDWQVPQGIIFPTFMPETG